MTTKYFILTKNENNDISNNDYNQFILLNKNNVYILPHNNLNYHLTNGIFEGDLIEWCKQFGNDNKNMLDVGAHTGTYTISLSKYFNHVYSFEPQKMTYYALCGSVALSNIQNVTCYNFGLGSESQVGEQMLKIISVDGGGSTLHMTDNSKIIKEESVIIKTLDELDLENIGFIKIDVEDNEYYVIFGAIDTIIKSNYPKILYESNVRNKNLENKLIDLGYKILNIIGYSNMYLASI